MIDKAIALIAFAVLAGFLGVKAVFVEELDLYIVVVVVLAFVAFDLYGSLFRKGEGDRNGG